MLNSIPVQLLKKGLPIILIIIFFASNGYSQNICKPVQLKCEHLVQPLGIDVPQPRLSWTLEDTRQRAKQTAYTLLVSTDSTALVNGKTDFWQTAKTASDSMRVSYGGKPLQPFTKYFWQVFLWDKDGKKTASDIAAFETGLMHQRNWKGTWISDNADINVKPAPYFRKVFAVQKKVKSARAYIAAAGLYELYINGEKTGNHRLDPMYTRYDRRNLYVTYDVTAQLQSGANAVGALLGNGWYNHQSIAVWDFEKAPWRARPAFCLDLRIAYEDGSVETITSDKSWKTALSPVIFNSIYTGEHYDARLEQRGWNGADFVDTAWRGVINRQAPSNNIVAQAMQPVRNVERLQCKSMNRLNDTTYVFDLGRNISGVSQITLNGDSGTVVRLVHGERLNKNSFPDQSNVDYFLAERTRAVDPFAIDIYKLSGRGEETFMPRFNYKGFQYVAVVSNKPIRLAKESLTGYFMHSDVAPTGSINTSSPLINKIWVASNASYLSNLFGYPTDCPQREKNGWTGDAHIASELGLYNFDGIAVYEKWMADHRDEQQPNGVLPSIIPTDGWGYEWGNGPDWTSTIAIIPWNVYLFYGDPKLLHDCYDNIKRYVDHINERYPTGLTNWGLGDWIPVKSKSPVELTSSIYYFVDADILAKAAKILGRNDDHKKYATLASKIKNAINARYLNSKTGIYAQGHQTEQSMPLCWGIVPERLKTRVAEHLADSVAANNYHLDVGLLGTKAILNALSENGQAETAYRLASQDMYPSWGWWIMNGATTLYENWDVNAQRDLSMNHIMFGEIDAWLYKGLGGIKPDEHNPGFKNVLLAPNFVSGLDSFEAVHVSPYGKILSSWKRDGNTVTWQVTVPPNASATITFPAGKVFSQGRMVSTGKPYKAQAGNYLFTITQ